jgi:hypothetical protein
MPKPPKLVCFVTIRYGNDIHARACHRQVVWHLTRVPSNGHARALEQRFYCAAHFDTYCEENWDALNEFDIERMSDDEGDFNQYQWGEGKREPVCQIPKPRVRVAKGVGA